MMPEKHLIPSFFHYSFFKEHGNQTSQSSARKMPEVQAHRVYFDSLDFDHV